MSTPAVPLVASADDVVRWARQWRSHLEATAGAPDAAAVQRFFATLWAAAQLEAAPRAAFTDALHASGLPEFLCVDPCTRQALHKPRGYAGDAQLIDLIAHHPSTASTLAATPPLGRALHRLTTECLAGDAVRWRIRRLAEAIDATAGEAPAVCSIACGFARELEHSAALRERRLARFLAIDQDPWCEQLLRSAWPTPPLEPLTASVGRVLRTREWSGGFDLVYASGLFDYLADATAAALVARMFDMLRPGGRVLIANFHPRLPQRGYLDLVMRWPLIYRTAPELGRLLPDAARAAGSWQLFEDPWGAVVYCELRRMD